MGRPAWVEMCVLPTVLLVSVGGTVAAVRAGLHEVVAVGATTALAGVGLTVAQWWASRDRAGFVAHFAREAGTDLLHLVVSNGVVNATFKTLAFAALLALAAHTTGVWWPHDWPLLVQLAIAMVAGEAAFYTAHRLAHEVPLLWRVHAVHHSSEQLTVLSSGRNHPLNALVSYAAQTLPALFMGAGPEVLVALSVFTTVHGMFQHVDLGLRFGPLNKVFATSLVHHWHHSAVPTEGNSNYGSNLVLFDLLFGTWRVPEDGERPARLGLDSLSLPRSYLAHLVVPFRWARFQVSSAAPTAPERRQE